MSAPRLFIANGVTMRLVPELAMEIGLHESLVLLQVDFLLATKGVPVTEFKGVPEGTRWVRISTRELQSKFFPFWSVATIDRTITDMAERRLLMVAHFMDGDKDTTRWLTYGPECLTLMAAKMVNVEDSSLVAPAKPPAKAKETKAPSNWEMAQALATVTGMNFELNRGRLLKEASAFKDFDAHDVLALFGPGQTPWYLYDFRGKQGSLPSLSQVRSEWAKMSAHLQQVTVKGEAAPKREKGTSLRL